MKGEFISIKTAEILADEELKKRQEKNKMILDMWDKEGLAQGWVDAHLRYKELQEQNKILQEKLNDAREYISVQKDEIKKIRKELEICKKNGEV